MKLRKVGDPRPGVDENVVVEEHRRGAQGPASYPAAAPQDSQLHGRCPSLFLVEDGHAVPFGRRGGSAPPRPRGSTEVPLWRQFAVVQQSPPPPPPLHPSIRNFMDAARPYFPSNAVTPPHPAGGGVRRSPAASFAYSS